MAGLIGIGHNRILDRLKDQVQSVASGDQGAARIVILRGRSGLGKSRIIREFYEFLREGEAEPKYWPSLASERVSDGPLQQLLFERKLLGPDAESFRWPEKSVPSFGWWVIDCARKPGGGAIDAAAQALPSFKVHMPALAFAWGRKSSWLDKVDSAERVFEERLRELVNSGATDAAAELIGKALEFTIPFFGLGIEWFGKAARAGVSKVRNMRDFRADVHVGRRATDAQTESARDLFSAIGSFALADLPSIVVIEDLHDMGAGLSEFLDNVARSGASSPVLVVATAWPEREATGTEIASDTASEYGKWRFHADNAAQVEVWDVPVMATDELAAVVNLHAPGISDRDLAQLVKHFPNPFALNVFLSLPDTRERLADYNGDLQLQPGDLEGYPHEVNRELYDLIWLALPSRVQQALMFAAGARVDKGNGRVDTFIGSIVAAATEAADLLDGSEGAREASHIQSALNDAATTFAWLAGDLKGMRFRERDLAMTASTMFAQRYKVSNPRRERLRDATVQELARWIHESRRGGYLLELEPTSLAAARWLVEISDVATIATAVARIALARDSSRRGDRHTAAALLAPGPWAEPLDADHAHSLSIRALECVERTTIAEWGVERNKALSELAEMVPQLLARFGRSDPTALEVRFILLPDGKYSRLRPPGEEVLNEYKSLLDDQELYLPWNDAALVYVRHQFARLLSMSGRESEALEQREQIHKALREGPHPSHNVMNGNATARADLLWNVGRLDEAEGAYGEILRRNSASSQWIDALTSLCGNLIASGEASRATSTFAACLAEFEEVQGKVFMSGREAFARHLSRLGNHDTAAEQLLTGWNEYDQLRDNPTLSPRLRRRPANRRTVVQALRKVGRLTEAVEQADRWLLSYLDCEEPRGRHFLDALSQLTALLAQAGRATEGVLRYDAVIERQSDLLSTDHSEVHAMHGYRAAYIERWGITHL